MLWQLLLNCLWSLLVRKVCKHLTNVISWKGKNKWSFSPICFQKKICIFRWIPSRTNLKVGIDLPFVPPHDSVEPFCVPGTEVTNNGEQDLTIFLYICIGDIMCLVASARKDKVSLKRCTVLTVQSTVGTEGDEGWFDIPRGGSRGKLRRFLTHFGPLRTS